MRRIAFISALIVTAAMIACKDNGAPDQGNPINETPTASELNITDQDLSLMVLPLKDMGPEYAKFELSDDSGFQSNAHVIETADDVEDRRNDVAQFGRINGYEDIYLSAKALRNGAGVFMAGTDVDLLADAEKCSASIENYADDMVRAIGTTNAGWTAEKADKYYPGQIGQRAVGVTVTIGISAEAGLPPQVQVLHGTIFSFCRGRLMGGATIIRADNGDAEEATAAMARKLDQRIQAVLDGDVQPEPTSISGTTTGLN